MIESVSPYNTIETPSQGPRILDLGDAIAIMRRPGIRSGARRVWLVLESLAHAIGDRTLHYPGHQRIAAITGELPSNVRTYMATLRGRGIIQAQEGDPLLPGSRITMPVQRPGVCNTGSPREQARLFRECLAIARGDIVPESNHKFALRQKMAEDLRLAADELERNLAKLTEEEMSRISTDAAALREFLLYGRGPGANGQNRARQPRPTRMNWSVHTEGPDPHVEKFTAPQWVGFWQWAVADVRLTEPGAKIAPPRPEDLMSLGKTVTSLLLGDAGPAWKPMDLAELINLVRSEWGVVRLILNHHKVRLTPMSLLDKEFRNLMLEIRFAEPADLAMMSGYGL